MWLDFSAYHLSDKQLEDKLIQEAKVVLNPGISYGEKGTQHMRINIACPRDTLKEGLQRIAKAFQ
ncbi:aminotransferase, class II [Tetragenococcus muriaticus PMC-11-5]|uniref:Aminotransferase, class II n=2 Tax=Tetragenococcus muriaticus TaxID=64642 RepID=A0A091BXC1_9ENTE|nr:aminotransferase, class II [Tetragenococcus muriaticus PMC-11-5]